MTDKEDKCATMGGAAARDSSTLEQHNHDLADNVPQEWETDISDKSSRPYLCSCCSGAFLGNTI